MTQQELAGLTGLGQGLISNILSTYHVRETGKEDRPGGYRAFKVYDRVEALEAVKAYFNGRVAEYEGRIMECKDSIANINRILKGE